MPAIPLRVVSESPSRPPSPVPVTPSFGSGFYGEEFGEGLSFRWLSLRGELRFEPVGEPRFLELEVHSAFHDLSQQVGAAAPDDRPLAEWPLIPYWNLVSLPLSAGADGLTLSVNRLFPPEYYPGDGRALAVRVRGVHLHADAARHEHVDRQHRNAVRNRRELLEGRVVLESTPPKVGIDMQGACNVKPPCVYCAWDFNKALEGANVDAPFTAETLSRWGNFFLNSAELVNCSIGEPFMTKDVDPLLDAFGERGKLLELTTNGQILTDANIARLLGRRVHLYVSLDAATPETYARLRNERFLSVLENVRRLVAAKGGRGGLPLVYAVFMPMRANRHEVDAVVDLCASLQVDWLVVRPLNDSEGVNLVFDRGGYHYDYQKEILPFPELVRISGRIAERCRVLGVDVADQLDFGGDLRAQFPAEFEAGREETRRALASCSPSPPPAPEGPGDEAAPPAAEAPAEASTRASPVPSSPKVEAPKPSLGLDKLPACVEPWVSLYVLRRGTLPCCYGGRPIAGYDDFESAWNGPLMQAIRGELKAGRFHGYCYDSPDCPIVKKAVHAHRLSWAQRGRLWLHRTHDHWARAGYGWPGAVYRQVRHRFLNLIGHFRR